MNMGIMPVTGIPLPLMSYGGSSVMAFLWLSASSRTCYMRRYAVIGPGHVGRGRSCRGGLTA